MKIIHTVGKRKTATARATLRPGTGIIRINSRLLTTLPQNLSKAKITEPLLLAGDVKNTVDIKINVKGGGTNTQAEAVRLAIAKALAEYNKELKKTFLEYDRTFLVADVRRKETSKPNRQGKSRAKRQKSYR
ncbi:30S ribosomal protein S9 [Candidatus Woesearchaeota archaeon]|nr:MAG: 30S ribosomal protein S9 [Candidatus Woesearchaeota archaeon ex4484_78]RLE47096.1 MAG: 30S ribosomal protein S9 [Candidatus Woesearchaeota archaeon]